jgi:hypothetical protein
MPVIYRSPIERHPVKRLIHKAIPYSVGGLLLLLPILGGIGAFPPAVQAQTPTAGAPATGAEQLVTVTAHGASTYQPSDLARSREEAIEAARRDAVEQVSGVIISSESEMKNFDLVKDEVLTRTQGFVRSSKVIKEGKDGPMYAVMIEAQVSKGAFLKEINDSLEGLYRRVGRPRVMLFIKESQSAGDVSTSNAAGLGITEKEIRKILLAQGFTFIDPRVVNRAQMAALEAKGKNVDPGTITELGQTTKAEIVIVGEARTSNKGEISKFYRVQADLSLDVLKTDNGQVMASDVYSAVALHINPDTAVINALQKAAQEETPKLMQQVTYQWLKDKNEGSRLELVIRNATFGDLVNLRKSLANNVRGVKRVTQRSFSKGIALLELETRDPSDRVAESLNEAKFEGFALEIVDVTPTSLIVNLKKP